MKNVTLSIAIFALVYITSGFSCGSSNPPPPPPSAGGFYVETTLNGVFQSGVTFGGQWQSDISGAQGSIYTVPNYTTTDIVGNYYVANGRAPANWLFTEFSGPCAGQSAAGPVALQGTADLTCLAGVIGGGEFTISPTALNASSPPSSVSITGSGFTTTYGMPRVQYYYNNGTYVGQVSATHATSTVISAPPLSGLSNDPAGVYIGEVQNAKSSGQWETVGAVSLDLISPTSPNIGSAVWTGHGSSNWSGGGCFVPQPITVSAVQQSNTYQWTMSGGGSPYAPGTAWSWKITDAEGTLLSGTATGGAFSGTYTASRTPIQTPSSTFSGSLNYPGCPTTMIFNTPVTLTAQ